MQSDLVTVVQRVRQIVLTREIKARAMGHRPLLPDEADQQLNDRVRGFVSEFAELSNPDVGRFYASLGVDRTLLDQFQARILAEYAYPQLMAMSLE